MEAGFIPVGASSNANSNALLPTVVAPPANVIRAPSLKRGKMEEAISDRIKLETVFGLTVSSNAALDCDPNTEVVAYPAGCTVVLYNVRKNRQSHVLNASRKSVTCVAFSPDGRYLATGECGHAPAVRVWDLQDPTASGAVQIAEFPGHTHGVNCVAFSTSAKYLVSVGSQHDMIVNVWDWRANLKLASNKVSSRVKAVSFSESGNYFVTVGFRHVKFWYLEYSRNAKFKEPVPLMGRSAILGEQKDNEFCDVVCGRGDAADSTYAITRGGLLCEFNSRRLLDKWVELRTTSANCMAIGANYIFVGCAEGIVRCFAPDSLRYITTLPRTHYLGVDVAQGVNINHMFSQPANAHYPDAIALTYDERNHKLTCVYNDHSLYVWDVRDIKRVGKSHSALYHSACIWGVDMVSNGDGALAPGSFLTCSSDDTVRVWNLKPTGPNIYSNELNKIIYIDPELKFLKDVDLTATSDKDKSKTYDDKIGVRCVRVSPCGRHVAAGDRAGNVWVHAADGAPLHTLEAHDAEVLCLEYAARPRLLASASRDRLVHVFLVDRGYQILQTLDEHSSSITAVRFLSSSSGLQMVSCGADKTILFRQLKTTQDGSYQFARGQNVSGRTTLYDMEVDAGGRHILTACQDRNVRVYSAAHGRHTKTFRGTTAEDGTLIKVALDNSGIYLATSSTDKILSVYDYYSGECMATMYGHSEIVTGLKFTPDCQHLVSASGDGCIFVWRVPHDMVVTMRARLAQQAIRQGRKVAPSTNGASGLDSETDSQFGSPPRELGDANKFGTPVVADYTLRIGKLPSWAKKSLGDELAAPEAPPTPGAAAGAPAPPARGKWAARIQPAPEKRVDSDGSKDSSLDSGTDTRYIEKRRDQTAKQRPKSLNLSQLPRVEALFRHFDATMKTTYDILTISPRVEKVTLNMSKVRSTEGRTRHHTDDSSLGSFKYEDQESTEHDGDIEDISDGERTSSSERGNRPTYYPGNNDDETPGEFMVNAMDVEELRQSVRRAKRWPADAPRLQLPPAPRAPHAPPADLSGSGHDSDDDEVSTPSGDNADRNPLSGSCESIDTAGRREKYLKSAFDSLSGVELDSTLTGGNNSLSAQHLSRTPTSRDPEAVRRREELQRRILETRRQLENVAFRSNLKSSQSTTDLSYLPEKDNSRRNRPVSMAVPSNSRPYGVPNLPFHPEENLDSLNFFDSLNPYQNMNLDYRNKNPYAIPANLNHKIMPEYLENIAPYIPPHAGIVPNQNDKRNTNYMPYNKKPMVFKEQLSQKQQPQAFTTDMAKKPVQSKVFNRLFPVNPSEEKEPPPKIPPRNFHLNLSEKTQPKLPKPNSRSIFKNYKSCPVSPVSEECKWADKVVQNNQNQANTKPQVRPTDPKKRNSLSFFVGFDNRVKESGKSIVDTIKSDTEKMIAEITKKYGDLDEYDPNNEGDLDLQPTKEVEEKDDGNFSSDSLEDCSLSQDVSCKNKLYSKKICKKHTKTASMPRRAISNYEIYGGTTDKPTVPYKPPCISQKSSTLPRNMPSNIDDNMDENYTASSNSNMYRCQSVLTKRCITRSNESVLSDNSNCSSVSNEIFLKYGNEVAFQQAKYDSRYNLNDSQNCSFENLNESDEQYLENHRHSSASFFLNQKKYMKSSCSQESMLSDEMYLDNDMQLSRTNCNSLESVLSDDSECTKSAPLEMLFEGARTSRQSRDQPIGIPRNSKSCYEFDNSSKSYGSSPNNVSYMGGYMYNNYLGENTSNYRETIVSPKPPSHKVYGFDVPAGEFSGHKTVTRSKSLYDSASKQAPPPPAKSIAYYFDGNNIQQYAKEKKGADEIPRLNTGDYMANTSKSLQPKFAEKHKYKSEMEGCEQNTMVKSKSCSFEVVLEPASKPNPLKNLIEKRNSHVQKNLEKFEEQIRKNIQTKVNKNQLNKEKANAAKNNNITKSLERGSGSKNNNVTMEFVPHKPPKPMKRTSSIKMNNRLKAGLDKSTLSSSISSQYKAKLDGLQNKNYSTSKNQEDTNSNKLDMTDNAEKSFDVFVKEKDINENKSEIQMDSLEVYAMQRMERMHHVSMDSLDVIDDSHKEFSKDSLDYFSEVDKKNTSLKSTKNQMNRRIIKVDIEAPCHSRQNTDAKENIAPVETSDEVKKYKYIERKLEIINKLVEMEERKILQEKILKEWRMRPLKANINDGKGVVKVLSRKFEKLATKQNTASNFASLTLEEVDTDTDTNSENKEIKRNLSLPDILDSDQIGGLVTVDIEVSNDAGNEAIELDHPENLQLNNTVRNELKTAPKTLSHRVYNEMVIPKTDVHLDSENYESSTTSSSCTNSPKRLSIYGFHRPKVPLRKTIRMPGPRLCLENQIYQSEFKIRPVLGTGGAVRNTCLSRKMPFQTQVLPSKFSPVQANRTHLSPSDLEEETPGMRRAISLSDLAKPVPAPRTPQAAAKATPPASANSSRSPSGFLRPAPRYTNKSSNMTRSSSVGVLNQSDSESDPQPPRQQPTRNQGLMRPTISSMNKAAANTARRRGLVNSYSTASVSTVAREESSSEAEDRAGNEQPTAAPRPRAASADRAQRRLVGRSGSERDLSAKAREVTARLATNTRQRSKQEPPAEQNLSPSQLCLALTEQLTKTAGKVVHLYRRLQREPNAAADISGLETAILETQKVLRSAVMRSQNGGEALSSLSSTEGDYRGLNVDSTRQKLENLVSKEATAAGNPAMSLIEQYSDILLNMMQNKMVNQFSQSPQSLPPHTREPGAES
ncbi:unnamed protein product [Parnassius apollo]|uniref:(apollo) hypothetical protein n=1 Tax=Parnassius apollo TaxID=110799 RepID=A0A8S3WBG5_PARAO|nr:unnamed protein product [Parnassius apollo]